MKKLQYLAAMAVLTMGLAMGACSSSGSEKGGNDSTATQTTQTESSEDVTFKTVAAANPAVEKEVISYNGKLKDVPAGAVLTVGTIQATAHPTLIEFGATWCGPCKQVKPFVESLAGKYDGKAEFLYVDIDNCPEVAKEFGVGQNVPVVVVASAKGEYEKFTGLDEIKSKTEEKLKAVIEKK